MKLKILTSVIIISLFAIWPAKIFAKNSPRETARIAINHYFCHAKRVHRPLCALGRQALNVADCETGHTFRTWASNGQYLGIFQMGSHERKLFGYGSNAWEQTRGALNYYKYEVRNGQWGWTPWSCKPY